MITVGWRLICADCGIDAGLMKVYEEVRGDDGELVDRDFELCGECINKRESEEDEAEIQHEENGDLEGCDDLDGDPDLGDCGLMAFI